MTGTESLCSGSAARKLDGTRLGPDNMNRSGRLHLWQDIALALAAKLVLLTCLYAAFFGPSHRPPADAAAVSARLLDIHHR